MHFTIERQHMVFAEREYIDILYYNHLVVVFFEQSVGENLVWILEISTGEHLHGLCYTHRSLY